MFLGGMMLFDRPYIKRPDRWLEHIQRVAYEVALGVTHRGRAIAEYQFLLYALRDHADDDLLKRQWLYITTNVEKLKKVRLGYVYLLDGGGYVKIGKANQPLRRIKQISPQLPFACEFAALIPSADAFLTERVFHDNLEPFRTRGEWFNLDERMLQNILEIPCVIDDSDTLDYILSGAEQEFLTAIDVPYLEHLLAESGES